MKKYTLLLASHNNYDVLTTVGKFIASVMFVLTASSCVNTDNFQTDLPVNGASILNEIGKNHLLDTGDDSKMIVPAQGGGYEYVSGTKITTSVAQRAIKEAISDGIISPDILN